MSNIEVVVELSFSLQEGGGVSQEVADRVLADQGQVAQRVCILTGSIGAPAGLGRFFQSLERVLPLAFVIVVPISPHAVPLLCDYISRHTKIRVLPALTGHILRHCEAIIVPSDRLLMIDEANRITLVTPDVRQANQIDQTMKAFARHFRNKLGAIVFSGIGEDGRQGCCSIVENGGEVWTQAAESCHYSSMPRYVSEACQVRFSATPEQLALRLYGEFSCYFQRQNELRNLNVR
jgi:chemosensory pili system protein ChpB (putative protein-glutamate methylesterase)